MKSRLEDLLSTADLQLASRSYDAAIDTYRTALGEPGALEAGVEERLQAASQARDEACGVEGLPAAPPLQMVEPATMLEPAGLNPQELGSSATQRIERDSRSPEPPPLNPQALGLSSAQLDPDSPALQPASPKTGDWRRIEPEPSAVGTPRPDSACGPIEPPSFHLIEDDPSMLERPGRERRYIEEPPLSILDPTARPEEPNHARVALLIFVAFIACWAIVTVLQRASRDNPSSDRAYPVDNGVTAPTLISKVDPEYTEAARESKIEGTVALFVEVDQTGGATVRGILQSLEPGLDQRAIEAVNRWRYRPATRDGRPVMVREKVEVNFRLP